MSFDEHATIESITAKLNDPQAEILRLDAICATAQAELNSIAERLRAAQACGASNDVELRLTVDMQFAWQNNTDARLDYITFIATVALHRTN